MHMKYLLPLLILINYQKIQGILEWTVTEKVTNYGQSVTLFCNISNCCPKFSGWTIWTAVEDVEHTLFTDVKTAIPNTKYDGKAFTNGYTLVIQNITEKDLNISYACVYDATFGEKKILLEEDVFTDTTSSQQDLPTENAEDDRLSGSEIVSILVGVFFVTSVLAVVLFKYGGRKKRKGTRNRAASITDTTSTQQDLPTENAEDDRLSESEIVSILVGVFFATSFLAVVLFKYGGIKKRKGTRNRNGNRAASITGLDENVPLMEFEKKMVQKFAEYDTILGQLQYEINAKSSTGDNASASEEHDNSHSKDDPVNTCLHGPVLDPEKSMKADNNGTSIRNGASGSSDEIFVQFTKEELFFVAFCYVVWYTLFDVVYDRLEPHKANFDPKSYCAIAHTYDEHRRKSYRQNKTKPRKKITNKVIGENIEVIRSRAKKEDINVYFFKEKESYIQLYSKTVIKEKNDEDPYTLNMDREESC